MQHSPRTYKLKQRWSPEQIALTPGYIYLKGHEYRVSHETIYHCIYAQPVGQLRRDLISCLRQSRNKRVPRSKGQDRRGQMADMVSIHLRPPAIEDRQFPGHWEGDLIKGQGNAIAQPMRQSLTYDQGREMALHKKFTEQTGMAVPHSPWQRSSNENTNGLVRQYLPRVLTCRATAKNNWMQSPMKSIPVHTRD